MVRPKKNLGQHFLTDPGIASRIVQSMDTNENSVVIEVGPGKGVLTGELLENPCRSFRAIEIDAESVAYLRSKYPGHAEKIIHADFIKADLPSLAEGPGAVSPVHIIGNFPYNISSQIFFKVFHNRHLVKEVTGMVQKEVARRITSPPGSKEYGILSVLLQAYFRTEYLFTVKPGSFFPPPKVTSAVIRLTRNNTDALDCDEKLFFRIVKTCFNQRRKTIRNSIKTILLNLDNETALLARRPEQLSVDEFVTLTRWAETQETRE